MEAYLDNTMKWVKEVWRVLKPTGSFVLNIGDCFVRQSGNEKDAEQTKRDNDGGPADGKFQKHSSNFPKERMTGIYKTKQLLSVSSFAYCRIVSETDFVCRGEHLWCKPNVPSPIRSRLKHSHEKLFWFVKDADKYYFDAKAWMKKIAASTPSRMEIAHLTVRPQSSCFVEKRENTKERDSPHSDNINLSGSSCFRSGKGEDYLKNEDTIEHSWRIVPVGAKQSGFELEGKQASEHIAPFPENLIEPYIKSLCPHEGVVLDPFAGSFTTARVCLENQRNSINIELSESYIKYGLKRLNYPSVLNVDWDIR